MLAAPGRETDARSVLEHYVTEPKLGNHASYLAEYLPEIGHGDLVQFLQIRDT